MYFQKS